MEAEIVQALSREPILLSATGNQLEIGRASYITSHPITIGCSFDRITRGERMPSCNRILFGSPFTGSSRLNICSPFHASTPPIFQYRDRHEQGSGSARVGAYACPGP
jgi:hypothetical protein